MAVGNFKSAVGIIINSDDNNKFLDLIAQKQEILLYANDNKFNVVDWYCVDNNEVCSFEQAIQKPEFSKYPYDAVIAFSNEYITADIVEFFYYSYILDRKSISLLTVKKDIPHCDNLESFAYSLINRISNREGRTLVGRTSNARRIKAAHGGYSGGRAPMGYEVQNGKLVINPAEAKMVKEVFALRSDGFTLQQIADLLNLEGITSRSGKPFAVSNIQSILRNKRTYLGEYRYGDGDWVKGEHEPILTTEESPT